MSFLLDFLFPRTCLGCKKPGQYFCSDCLRKVKLVETQVCPVCEKASFSGQTHPFCQEKDSLDGLVSLFSYGGTIKKAIHQLKFGLITDLVNEFWDLSKFVLKKRKKDLASLNQFIKNQKPTLVPVPLYWYKKNFRGFNQSEIFAQKLAEFWNLKVKEDLLIRSKFTLPQAGLTQKQRKENVENAFAVSPLVYSSLFNILLIDDIWTTGVTLKNCAALLKKSGAKTVWGLTIAR